MKKILWCLCAISLCLTACSKKTNKQQETPPDKTVDLQENSEPEAEDSRAGAAPEDAATDEKPEQRADHPRRGVDRGVRPGRSQTGRPRPTEEAQAKADVPSEQEGDSGFDFTDESPSPSPQKPAAKPAPALAPKRTTLPGVDSIVSIRELREKTGFAGALTESSLPGQNPTLNYNWMRLATDNPGQLGFSVQVWKPGNEPAALKRFEDLYAQSFGGEKIHDVGADAFVASHHKIHELGFFDKNKRAAVLMSCSQEICSINSMKALANLIQKKL